MRYTQRSLLQSTATPRDADEAREQPAPAGARESAHARVRARASRARTPTIARYIDAILAQFRDEPFVYTLEPPLLDARSGRRVPVRRAARLLRALRERVRGAAARGRHSRAHRHRLPGRRDQSARQLPDRAPVGRARLGRGARRRTAGSASIPTAAVVAARASRSGSSRALAAGEPVPLFARLDDGWLKDVQLACDAFNHAWRRNLVGFDRDRQRALWRELELDRLRCGRSWRSPRCAAACVGRLVVALARVAARASRSARSALWTTLHAARARRPAARMPHEGPLAFAARAARAGRSSRSRSPRSASRTRRCATARRRCGPASARRWSRRSSARSRCCRRRHSSARPRPELRAPACPRMRRRHANALRRRLAATPNPSSPPAIVRQTLARMQSSTAASSTPPRGCDRSDFGPGDIVGITVADEVAHLTVSLASCPSACRRSACRASNLRRSARGWPARSASRALSRSRRTTACPASPRRSSRPLSRRGRRRPAPGCVGRGPRGDGALRHELGIDRPAEGDRAERPRARESPAGTELRAARAASPAGHRRGRPGQVGAPRLRVARRHLGVPARLRCPRARSARSARRNGSHACRSACCKPRASCTKTPARCPKASASSSADRACRCDCATRYAALGRARLHIEYGTREVGMACTTFPVDHDASVESVGPPVAVLRSASSIRTGRPLPAGEIGEVRLRTTNMVHAYPLDPVATARHFRDGWFHCGDLGSFTSRGSLCLHGRLDDMMNLNGIKIYPAEIERVLEATRGPHRGGVRAALDRARSDPRRAVEWQGAVRPDVADLMARARASLGVRSPRKIVLVDALPRTASGKVAMASSRASSRIVGRRRSPSARRLKQRVAVEPGARASRAACRAPRSGSGARARA